MHSNAYQMDQMAAVAEKQKQLQRRLSLSLQQQQRRFSLSSAFYNLRDFHPVNEPMVDDLFTTLVGSEWDLQPVPLSAFSLQPSPMPSAAFQQHNQYPAATSVVSQNNSDNESFENGSVCSDIFSDDQLQQRQQQQQKLSANGHVSQPFQQPMNSMMVNFNESFSPTVYGGMSAHDQDLLDEEERDQDDVTRFKPFHEEKWSVRYKELVQFHREHGHSAVPHTFPPNQQLARWVKRQRRQYKLLQENKPSTLTADRLEILNALDFVWDSHEVNWQEKLVSLTAYYKTFGDCNVPSNYVDKKLATWVKCQRRQYKLHMNGEPSSMTTRRIEQLEKINFQWEIRTVKSSRSKKAATDVGAITAPAPAPAPATSTTADLISSFDIPKSKIAMKRRRSSLFGAGGGSITTHIPTWARSA